MELGNLAVFISASLILIITPGPDMIYLVTHGIAENMNKVTGGILILLGLRLALVKRQ